ncbi:hypothetical protein [Prauserella endophytica]|uniref:hypothetical protein n=1 Tax=Prauserella endophytica TaxID=1592324 RepID=UPI001980A392|nr:hypothetical protein [Prauserella endophytica]
MSPTTAEVVRAAGGWLFDRVMAGWDVLVLVADPLNSRPLRILGAKGVDLEAALTSRVSGPRPHALAVDAGLYESDDRVQRLVVRSLDHGLTDVRLWGDDWTGGLDEDSGSVRHRLSVAARAFKAQALAATAAPAGSVDVTEVFRSGDLLPAPPSLVPTG